MKIDAYAPGNLPAEVVAQFNRGERADLHLIHPDGTARASLWWTHGPSLPGQTTGCVGHFHSDHAEAGLAILDAAKTHLTSAGCTIAVGPLNGSTWARYRFVTDRGPEPPFFLEPDNPDDWPQVFERAGFVPLATYSSSLVGDPGKCDPRVARAWARLREAGVTIRCLDPTHFERDLHAIFDVSLVSFVNNFLYSPIGRDAFLARYLAFREKIDPRFVLIAERQNACVGYLFAIPDYNEPLRGSPLRTIIGKTLAILPGRSFAGLGLVLASELHRRAVEAGFARVIHALQHESNKSRNLTSFFGEVMRRYTLFSAKLMP